MNDADDTREPDIVDKALHSFDHVLDLVHDKILRPILLAGRAIAFSGYAMADRAVFPIHILAQQGLGRAYGHHFHGGGRRLRSCGTRGEPYQQQAQKKIYGCD